MGGFSISGIKKRPYRAEIGALSRTFTSMVAAQLSENSTGCAHLFSGNVLFFLLSRKQPGLVQCLPDLSVNEHNPPASMFGKKHGELSEQRKELILQSRLCLRGHPPLASGDLDCSKLTRTDCFLPDASSKRPCLHGFPAPSGKPWADCKGGWPGILVEPGQSNARPIGALAEGHTAKASTPVQDPRVSSDDVSINICQ